MVGIGGLRRVRADRVRRRLLRDEDVREDIVDEVHHHWVVYTLPTLELGAAVALVWLMLFSSPQVGWALILVAAALLVHAAWKALVRFMDVFVVTNTRVF